MTERQGDVVHDRSQRRIDAMTTLAAEPAVRAAERAIMTESATVLADTLAISTAAESQRRLAHVLTLKDRAERDPGIRDAYQRAADDLRSWAGGVYLAALREPESQIARPTASEGRTKRKPVLKHKNPYSEEGISLRRSVPRPPFPGQRRQRPFFVRTPSEDADRTAEAAEHETTDPHASLEDLESGAHKDAGRSVVRMERAPHGLQLRSGES